MRLPCQRQAHKEKLTTPGTKFITLVPVLLLYHKSTQKARKKHTKNEKSVLFVCLKSGVEIVDI